MAPEKVDAFANEARKFAAWVAHDTLAPVSPREALSYLLSLYAAGLELEMPSEDFPDREVPEVSSYANELSQVSRRTGQLRSRFYSEVYDPLILPSQEPGVGDLVDDFSDIFTDLARGLYLYDLGLRSAAQWHWAFHRRVHWGTHATSAIRALHWEIARQ